MITLNLNGKDHSLDVPQDMPLLWAIRDVAGYSGTKFGCGMGLCGACTVHVDGQATRACVTPVSVAVGKKVTTLEALHADPVGQALQAAWLELGVAQCGYCQGGQLMTATALLKGNPNPDEAQIETAMAGNVCRCGTYNRIRAAIQVAAGKLRESRA
ncbi:Ferredoxin:(2Fe-2S)-binding protein [Azotobacter vinelandii CA]|uniref:Ferredoxin:(2Fe-2S)-binding protein n=2 Tax=Azotobacter vinelandii TaxID=354 RepID=C1DJJ5_AZOVD|nr:(2Fe-2S)-binding protein [Azotobacter vinelandii]ACO78764.1 Ferredoxin:(2Fe-2S)-binding protein [Azotobacter vinelandii DJ]AGK16622.1 Ferredoxin:(2Fe-2S)-binding protein [Azotobacter vinelandii CA]AGK20728.1 Ferredoxin:(2Fe-2S)-binding protein [Azotobacter vinelandii CA6]WKN19712.1 (2Fe-2S)-binding protein [Azotobacter vinelandii]SFX32968.1 isoquinoline 1-oxidoreductase, alpha subunit [Azotobacter vinelandii]